jgi:hypothetical protein
MLLTENLIKQIPCHTFLESYLQENLIKEKNMTNRKKKLDRMAALNAKRKKVKKFSWKEVLFEPLEQDDDPHDGSNQQHRVD